MGLNDQDRALKALFGKLGTSDAKRLIEEIGAETLNVAAQEIWQSTPLPADPNDAVANGQAELKTLFALTADPTVAGNEAWIARATPGNPGSARLGDWIPPDKFGAAYVTSLYDGNDALITVAAQITNGVVFDHKTGVLTVDNPGAFVQPFKITAHRYIGPKGVGTPIVTAEPLTIAVDYDDAGAIDPGVGVVFSTQAEVDAALGAAPAFKHIQAVWDALPTVIAHDVQINCADGVNRPASGLGQSYGWQFTGRVFQAGSRVSIDGDPNAANWPAVDPSLVNLTVDTFQTGSKDPWIDVSASHPGIFGAFDLRGAFAVLDTGQVSVIHEHTGDRIFVHNFLSPTPVGGSTKLTIARPGFILRNSLDDVNDLYTSGTMRIENAMDRLSGVDVGYCQIQKIGAFAGVTIVGCGSAFDNVVIDLKTYNSNGQGYTTFGANASCQFRNGAIVCPTPGFDPQDHVIQVAQGSIVFMSFSYISGSEDGILVQSGAVFRGGRCVYDSIGRTGGSWGAAAIMARTGAVVDFINFGNDKDAEIRNTTAGRGGLELMTGASFFGDSSPAEAAIEQRLAFKNIDGPCVIVRDSVGADLGPFPGNVGGTLIDLGGNTDVGVDFQGANATLTVGTLVAASGALGDVRMADGSILSWADILSSGPYVDPRGNRVKVRP